MGAGYKFRGGYQVAEDWEGRFGCTLPGASPLWWDLDEGSVGDLANGRGRCRECPIQRQCLEEAAKKKEYGLWGGEVVDHRGVVGTLEEWLVRREKRQRPIKPEVIDRRTCPECSEEFDVVRPRYTQKYCDGCRTSATHLASVARVKRSRERRAARIRRAAAE